FGVMLSHVRLPLFLVAAAVVGICATPFAFSQIVELRDYNGHMIGCARSGLRGFAMACGADQGYRYVFVGSVLSVTDLLHDEKSLRLAPEEVFYGNPPREVMAATSQAPCLPEIHPGDHWLFYLQDDRPTQHLLLSYGNSSGPVSDMQEEIVRLRQLARMSEGGIIRGHVTRPVWNDAEKVQTQTEVLHHKIVAHRVDNGVEYDASTDENGNYEFDALPYGRYELNANTSVGWWAE